MSSTPEQRQLFFEKPDLKIGPVETVFSQVSAEGSRSSETAEQNPLDDDVGPVQQRLAVKSRTLSLSAPGFLDEIVRLDRLYDEDDPIEVRHWIFQSPTMIMTDFSWNSEPGLGFDGSTPEHLARAHFDIELKETSD